MAEFQTGVSNCAFFPKNTGWPKKDKRRGDEQSEVVVFATQGWQLVEVLAREVEFIYAAALVSITV
jgi:hypothetical protein